MKRFEDKRQVACVFDKSHVMPYLRYQWHLSYCKAKIARDKEGLPTFYCKYHALHIFLEQDELEKHQAICEYNPDVAKLRKENKQKLIDTNEITEEYDGNESEEDFNAQLESLPLRYHNDFRDEDVDAKDFETFDPRARQWGQFLIKMRPFASEDVLAQVTHELQKESSSIYKPPPSDSEKQTHITDVPFYDLENTNNVIAKEKGFIVIKKSTDIQMNKQKKSGTYKSSDEKSQNGPNQTHVLEFNDQTEICDIIEDLQINKRQQKQQRKIKKAQNKENIQAGNKIKSTTCFQKRDKAKKNNQTQLHSQEQIKDYMNFSDFCKHQLVFIDLESVNKVQQKKLGQIVSKKPKSAVQQSTAPNQSNTNTTISVESKHKVLGKRNNKTRTLLSDINEKLLNQAKKQRIQDQISDITTRSQISADDVHRESGQRITSLDLVSNSQTSSQHESNILPTPSTTTPGSPISMYYEEQLNQQTTEDFIFLDDSMSAHNQFHNMFREHDFPITRKPKSSNNKVVDLLINNQQCKEYESSEDDIEILHQQYQLQSKL